MDAVEAETSSLIVAVPGAGKTTLVAAKVVREAERLAESCRRILCLTYTRAGVRALREKIAVGASRDTMSGVDITTIHSFCLSNILRPNYDRLSGYDNSVELVTSQSEEFLMAIEVVEGRPGVDPRKYENLRRTASGAPDSSNGLSGVNARAFWEALRQLGKMDSCTVLYYAEQILDSSAAICGGIAARYAWIFVDEYQDTSEGQLRIFAKIRDAGSTRFFLVGDPLQAIFGFAGANLASLKAFARETAGDNRIELEGSFRCERAICRDAQKIYPRDPPLEPFSENCALGTSVIYRAMESGKGALAIFVPYLVKNAVQFNNAAILCAYKKPLQDLYDELSAVGIPSTGDPTRPYMRSSLMDFVELCSDYLREPSGQGFGLCKASLLGLVASEIETAVDDRGNEVANLILVRVLSDVASIMDAAEFTSAVVAALLRAIPSRSTDLDAKLSKQGARGAVALAGKGNRERLAELAKSRYSIVLSTIHGAKGLEFEAVAILCVHLGVLPSREHDKEEARKCYVAITRARSAVFYFGDGGSGSARYSPFLDRLASRG